MKRPAQRKPAKGNGAPQRAYPVYAAFNRMFLMHRLLYLKGLNRKTAAPGEIPYKVNRFVITKMLLFV